MVALMDAANTPETRVSDYAQDRQLVRSAHIRGRWRSVGGFR
jgi:hypothetical protein